MVSTLSNSVLKHCKHTPLMAASRPNWLDRKLRSHPNSVQLSSVGFQRDHPFLDGMP